GHVRPGAPFGQRDGAGCDALPGRDRRRLSRRRRSGPGHSPRAPGCGAPGGGRRFRRGGVHHRPPGKPRRHLRPGWRPPGHRGAVYRRRAAAAQEGGPPAAAAAAVSLSHLGRAGLFGPGNAAGGGGGAMTETAVGSRQPARFAPGEKRLVMEGTATPADKARSPYMYLPFEVPEGTETITVRYSYDDTGILDIGLVDPEIEPFPARRGFRGWSGSARREFFVAAGAATPGYMPGPVQAGVWQVILGLHRVPPQGCGYRVEVVLDEPGRALAPAATAEAEDNGAPPADEAVAAFRQATGKVWRRGDLHAHTFHSDGQGSPAELAALARRRGLEFLAITDHNTASHHRFLKALQRPGFLVIAGEELATDLGHANVWGVEGWVDFRLLGGDHVTQLVEEVHARGGVISVNHPKEGGPPWQYCVPAGVDCLEAWQMLWPINNRQALALYDELLRQGRRLTLVGGSDWHQPAAGDAAARSA